MALTVKRRKSGLLIPKTPKLIIPSVNNILGKSQEEEIVESEIKRIVKETISVNHRKEIKKIMFVLIYQRVYGEKEISKIYLRYPSKGIEKVIDAEEIENRGVALLEFFDYIITHGAIELQDAKKALEIM
jgi:hypothetical protein